jgi:pimeloyl-ACP methyl ester carboxylesterase
LGRLRSRTLSLPEDGIRREFLEDLTPGIAELIDPSVARLAWTQISRPGVIDALLDLHLDYQSNLKLYPRFQEYFREKHPPTLVIWGRDVQYYSPAAAMAYKRDLPDAEIEVINGGHWALESHGPQAIRATNRFLDLHYRARPAVAA